MVADIQFRKNGVPSVRKDFDTAGISGFAEECDYGFDEFPLIQRILTKVLTASFVQPGGSPSHDEVLSMAASADIEKDAG